MVRLLSIIGHEDIKITQEENSFRIQNMYVEYGVLKEHFSHLYLGPNAKEDQLTFEYLLNLKRDKKIVRLSHNPFR